MDHLCVFGASRGTGKEVVRLARKAGLSITAAVRNPDSMREQDGVRVAVSDVYDKASIVRALQGSDAVVSTVGPVRRQRSTNIYSVGVLNIARQMEMLGPKRLIVVDSIGVDPNFDLPWHYRLAMKTIAKRLYGFAFEDGARMEGLLQSTKLNWTAVRVPWLLNRPPRGFRNSIHRRLHHGPKLGRSDLAAYLLSILDDQRTYRTWTEVAW